MAWLLSAVHISTRPRCFVAAGATWNFHCNQLHQYKRCFLLCFGFLVVLDQFGAFSLANWCSIVFACIVYIGGLARVSSLGGKERGKAWLPCNQITALLIVLDCMLD